MARDFHSIENAVALLATGDEIRDGDILNTNSQEIAHYLFNHGVPIGMHMVTGDQIQAIEYGIHYLLKSHRALIITGGLGPTSDDLTRYALSNAVHRPLVFDDGTWDIIVKRLAGLGYHVPPQTNRQQALFPEGATIVPNPNGTAAGCLLQLAEQFIFMLPGPPMECLPMVHQVVLPTLQSHGLQKIAFHEKWLLFGVSEGQIAEELDEIARPFNCTTGYRLWYPYIEFKLHSSDQDDFTALVPKINQTVAPYLIGDGKQSASQLLIEKLSTVDFSIDILDWATGGLLESIIKTPRTYAQLNFAAAAKNPDHLQIEIKGLTEFWEGKHTTQTFLTIQFQQQAPVQYPVPFRGLRVKQYAAELICREVYDYIMTKM